MMKKIYERHGCKIHLVDNKLIIKVVNYSGDLAVTEGSLHKPLQHPNIVKCYSSIVINDKEYLSLEYVDGMSLERYNYRVQHITSILNIYNQILEGVTYIHNHGISHNDLKLENIMINKNNIIKIIDFGSASKHKTLYTSLYLKIGTILYMPPEMRTKSIFVSGKNDIWALGIILYELLIGTHPYTQYDGKINFGKVIDYDECSSELKLFIECLLTENPMKRPKMKAVNDLFNDVKELTFISSIKEYDAGEYMADILDDLTLNDSSYNVSETIFL